MNHQDDTPLLVKASRAADLLAVDVSVIYDLAAAGEIEKRYIGKGTRNFRISYASLEAYVKSLPTEPLPEAG